MSTLDQRLSALAAELAALPDVLVAFSGGVDSGVVLAAAVRALGADRVVAATAVSPSLPAAERDAAVAFAASLSVRHELPRTDELSREGYRANAGDRCAFCKAELVDVLTPLAARLGIADVVTGTNADDLRAGFRPGIRAAAERGAWAPLARAGMTKDDVRAAARRWGLPLADKPAAACLASRIAYGVPVSAEGLARVEQAEAALRLAMDGAGLAVRDLRVRDLGGDAARVEVDAGLVGALAGRDDLLAAVAGFRRVEVDPRGFRSGSMNELLPDPVRYR
ncbi:MAG: ATP-utilizing enzyme of the PP-loop superfamily [uncultured Blastococcus sp.]|uniref:ATP-utilizing enzyme of the PP-loop superfamily n=1 Tax=uncultured Blastococcus sp. TaxID=217144 RepID=A0A6J4H1H1_9ACTN|nr:MAG: ATP-utilizing enzyme of the PP-loop superfamily [uncultured Blastococcus sp.]